MLFPSFDQRQDQRVSRGRGGHLEIFLNHLHFLPLLVELYTISFTHSRSLSYILYILPPFLGHRFLQSMEVTELLSTLVSMELSRTYTMKELISW